MLVSYEQSSSCKALLAALLISTTAPSALAINLPIPDKTITPTLLATFASFALLYSREPSKKFEKRYSWATLKNIKLLTSNPKEYAANLWYILSDGFVGQCGKRKAKLQTTDGDNVYLTDGSDLILPEGILGWTDAYIKSTIKAAESAAFMYTMFVLARNPEWLKKIFDTQAEKSGFKTKLDKNDKLSSAAPQSKQ